MPEKSGMKISELFKKAIPERVKIKGAEWTETGRAWWRKLRDMTPEAPREVIAQVAEAQKHEAELVVEYPATKVQEEQPEVAAVIDADIGVRKNGDTVPDIGSGNKVDTIKSPETTQPPIIQKWLRQADEVFPLSKYSAPLEIFRKDREHTRPFYKDKLRSYYIADVNTGLPTFEGLTCDQWVAALTEQHAASILDVCCGAGTAVTQLEKAHPNATAYGVTGSTFYYENGGEKQDAMQLSSDRLALGNVAHLKDVLEQKWPGKKFDVIYSYQGLPYIPLPFLHFIQEIYPLLEKGGVAFLHDPPADYNEIQGLDQIQQWLSEKGYKFEFVTDEEKEHITKCSFQKTHEALSLPIEYSEGYKSSFSST